MDSRSRGFAALLIWFLLLSLFPANSHAAEKAGRFWISPTGGYSADAMTVTEVKDQYEIPDGMDSEQQKNMSKAAETVRSVLKDSPLTER